MVVSIFLKEWSKYVNTPLGYLFAAVFLLLSSFLFFFGLGEDSFWDRNIASVEQYFYWIPVLYVVFLPSLTMGLWSEEEKSGTSELLLSLPLQELEIVLGKFFAAWSFLACVLAASLPIPFFVWALGDLDLGVTFSGYLGCILLGGSYIALGGAISAMTREQISAYVFTLIAVLFFFLLGFQPILRFFSGELAAVLSFFSLSRHFETFRLGILDAKEVFFFLSFCLMLLKYNAFLIEKKRR
ncbi:gliding motility ABC transporter [Leptospira perolatii]|uniref:Gliding motility ABC transporter n=1 Tax=Leptospira perolatii TaxID=2023191 RepID=A0A2M9ZMW9_9LEPT|nr:gliding motility ABC transporter [Leptospira perolatii]PJZ73408.1 gliding motility ABC transporter [Leptospira perolatii]